jgi:hypothetical protein
VVDYASLEKMMVQFPELSMAMNAVQVNSSSLWAVLQVSPHLVPQALLPAHPVDFVFLLCPYVWFDACFPVWQVWRMVILMDCGSLLQPWE